MIIEQLEVVKITDSQFIIYHKDHSGELFKFEWELPSADRLSQNDRNRQTREYLTCVVARHGIQYYYADNIWPSLDNFCRWMVNSGVKTATYSLVREQIER